MRSYDELSWFINSVPCFSRPNDAQTDPDNDKVRTTKNMFNANKKIGFLKKTEDKRTIVLLTFTIYTMYLLH